MSLLDISNLSAFTHHVMEVSDEFEKGLEKLIRNRKTFVPANDIEGLQEEANKFIRVLRQHALSYLALWHLRAAIENGKNNTNKSSDMKVKQRVFECAARLYHGWYQIIDGNRYTENDPKYRNFDCIAAVNLEVVPGTTGFSYADLVRTADRPFARIGPFLSLYCKALKSRQLSNPGKLFQKLQDDELFAAMQKLDELKQCGNDYFIKEWATFIPATTSFSVFSTSCLQMEKSKSVDLANKTPCVYQFATLPLGWTTKEWQKYMDSGTVSPPKSAANLWTELFKPVPPRANPSVTQHNSSTAATSKTSILKTAKKPIARPGQSLPKRTRIQIKENDDDSSVDIGAGMMAASPLKSNATDDNNKPDQTTYNFARGIKNEKETCWLQSLLIALAQSRQLWHHLNRQDHLSHCTHKDPTKCAYCALLNILVCCIDGKTPVESDFIHRFNKYALKNRMGDLLSDSDESSPGEIAKHDQHGNSTAPSCEIEQQDPHEALTLLFHDKETEVALESFKFETNRFSECPVCKDVTSRTDPCRMLPLFPVRKEDEKVPAKALKKNTTKLRQAATKLNLLSLEEMLRAWFCDEENEVTCDNKLDQVEGGKKQCTFKGMKKSSFRMRTRPDIFCVVINRKFSPDALQLPMKCNANELVSRSPFHCHLIMNNGILKGHVRFGEYLNLDEFMENVVASPEKVDFRLSSVIRHIPSSSSKGGGHFVTYSRGLESDDWVKIDNHKVTTCTLDTCLGVNAYMLFYERVSDGVSALCAKVVDQVKQCFQGCAIMSNPERIQVRKATTNSSLDGGSDFDCKKDQTQGNDGQNRVAETDTKNQHKFDPAKNQEEATENTPPDRVSSSDCKVPEAIEQNQNDDQARGADSDCKKEGTKNEHKSDPEKNQEEAIADTPSDRLSDFDSKVPEEMGQSQNDDQDKSKEEMESTNVVKCDSETEEEKKQAANELDLNGVLRYWRWAYLHKLGEKEFVPGNEGKNDKKTNNLSNTPFIGWEMYTATTYWSNTCACDSLLFFLASLHFDFKITEILKKDPIWKLFLKSFIDEPRTGRVKYMKHWIESYIRFSRQRTLFRQSGLVDCDDDTVNIVRNMKEMFLTVPTISFKLHCSNESCPCAAFHVEPECLKCPPITALDFADDFNKSYYDEQDFLHMVLKHSSLRWLIGERFFLNDDRRKQCKKYHERYCKGKSCCKCKCNGMLTVSDLKIARYPPVLLVETARWKTKTSLSQSDVRIGERSYEFIGIMNKVDNHYKAVIKDRFARTPGSFVLFDDIFGVESAKKGDELLGSDRIICFADSEALKGNFQEHISWYDANHDSLLMQVRTQSELLKKSQEKPKNLEFELVSQKDLNEDYQRVFNEIEHLVQLANKDLTESAKEETTITQQQERKKVDDDVVVGAMVDKTEGQEDDGVNEGKVLESDDAKNVDATCDIDGGVSGAISSKASKEGDKIPQEEKKMVENGAKQDDCEEMNKNSKEEELATENGSADIGGLGKEMRVEASCDKKDGTSAIFPDETNDSKAGEGIMSKDRKREDEGDKREDMHNIGKKHAEEGGVKLNEDVDPEDKAKMASMEAKDSAKNQCKATSDEASKSNRSKEGIVGHGDVAMANKKEAEMDANDNVDGNKKRKMLNNGDMAIGEEAQETSLNNLKRIFEATKCGKEGGESVNISANTKDSSSEMVENTAKLQTGEEADAIAIAAASVVEEVRNVDDPSPPKTEITRQDAMDEQQLNTFIKEKVSFEDFKKFDTRFSRECKGAKHQEQIHKHALYVTEKKKRVEVTTLAKLRENRARGQMADILEDPMIWEGQPIQKAVKKMDEGDPDIARRGRRVEPERTLETGDDRCYSNGVQRSFYSTMTVKKLDGFKGRSLKLDEGEREFAVPGNELEIKLKCAMKKLFEGHQHQKNHEESPTFRDYTPEHGSFVFSDEYTGMQLRNVVSANYDSPDLLQLAEEDRMFVFFSDDLCNDEKNDHVTINISDSTTLANCKSIARTMDTILKQNFTSPNSAPSILEKDLSAIFIGILDYNHNGTPEVFIMSFATFIMPSIPKNLEESSHQNIGVFKDPAIVTWLANRQLVFGTHMGTKCMELLAALMESIHGHTSLFLFADVIQLPVIELYHRLGFERFCTKEISSLPYSDAAKEMIQSYYNHHNYNMEFVRMMTLQEYPFKERRNTKGSFLTLERHIRRKTSQHGSSITSADCTPVIQLLIDLLQHKGIYDAFPFVSQKDLGINFPLQFRRFTAEYDNSFAIINEIKNHLIHSFEALADQDPGALYEVPNYNSLIRDYHALMSGIPLSPMMHFLFDSLKLNVDERTKRKKVFKAYNFEAEIVRYLVWAPDPFSTKTKVHKCALFCFCCKSFVLQGVTDGFPIYLPFGMMRLLTPYLATRHCECLFGTDCPNNLFYDVDFLVQSQTVCEDFCRRMKAVVISCPELYPNISHRKLEIIDALKQDTLIRDGFESYESNSKAVCYSLFVCGSPEEYRKEFRIITRDNLRRRMSSLQDHDLKHCSQVFSGLMHLCYKRTNAVIYNLIPFITRCDSYARNHDDQINFDTLSQNVISVLRQHDPTSIKAKLRDESLYYTSSIYGDVEDISSLNSSIGYFDHAGIAHSYGPHETFIRRCPIPKDIYWATTSYIDRRQKEITSWAKWKNVSPPEIEGHELYRRVREKELQEDSAYVSYGTKPMVLDVKDVRRQISMEWSELPAGSSKARRKKLKYVGFVDSRSHWNKLGRGTKPNDEITPPILRSMPMFLNNVMFPHKDWKNERPTHLKINNECPNKEPPIVYGKGWDNSTRVTKTLGKAYTKYACSIREGKTVVGYERMSIPRTTIEYAVKQLVLRHLKRVAGCKALDQFPEKSPYFPLIEAFTRHELSTDIRKSAVFIFESVVPQAHKAKFANIDWDHECIFVADPTWVKTFDIEDLKNIMKHPGKMIDLPESFLRRVKQLDEFDHFFATRVVLKSVVPKRIVEVTYGSGKKNQITHCVTNFSEDEVFGDEDIVQRIMTRRVPFVDSRVVHVLGDGCRSSVSLPDEVPDSTERGCFTLVPTETKMSCVYGAFSNVARLLLSDSTFEAIHFFGDMSGGNPSFSTCLEKLRAHFEIKYLDCAKIFNSEFVISPQITGSTVPLVVSIGGAYNNAPSHCIGIFRDQIIDSTFGFSMPLSLQNLCHSMGTCITSVNQAVMLKPYPSTVSEYYNKIRANGDEFEFNFETYKAAPSAKRRRRGADKHRYSKRIKRSA